MAARLADAFAILPGDVRLVDPAPVEKSTRRAGSAKSSMAAIWWSPCARRPNGA